MRLIGDAISCIFITRIITVTGGLIALTLWSYFVTRAQVLQPLDSANVQADAADYYRYA